MGREMDTREQLEWVLAIHFSQNRMPDMSGDPRRRLTPLTRRNMDAAIDALLESFDVSPKAARSNPPKEGENE